MRAAGQLQGQCVVEAFDLGPPRCDMQLTYLGGATEVGVLPAALVSQIADHLGHDQPSLNEDVHLGGGLASPEAATALQRSR